MAEFDCIKAQDIWFPVDEYENYVVNIKGKVMNTNTGNQMQQQKGSIVFHTNNGKKFKQYKVKSLLESTFHIHDKFTYHEIFNEKWIIVKDFPNYCVSSLGRVYKFCRRLYMSQSKNRKGYMQVTLVNKKERKTLTVHRLVGLHFICNPTNLPQVNHKLKNSKDNNRVENLEWCTQQENSLHSATHIQTQFCIPILCYDTNHNFIKEYPSLASTKLDGFDDTLVSKCLHGVINSHKNFIWKRKTEVPEYKDLEKEIWKNLKDSVYSEINIFENYSISSQGRLRNKKGKLLNLNCNPSFELTANGKKHRKYIYTIVLMGFNVLNPENKPEIDHLDSNHHNNRLENLVWSTRQENMNNAFTQLKIKDTKALTLSKNYVLYNH